ncbi:MAG: hypothetical protein U5K69_23315 [Balneolaceae bacterium]|nr:hypothetical protein [Balneolaceae bacterium]
MGQDTKVVSLNDGDNLYNGVEISQDVSHSTLLNKIISVDIRGIQLLDAIHLIADKADLEVVYNSKLLATIERNVDLKYNQITLKNALWKALEGTGLRFAVAADKQLVLLKANKKGKEETAPVLETVSGQVTDASSGNRFPG